jgi:hypothetical protein
VLSASEGEAEAEYLPATPVPATRSAEPVVGSSTYKLLVERHVTRSEPHGVLQTSEGCSGMLQGTVVISPVAHTPNGVNSQLYGCARPHSGT